MNPRLIRMFILVLFLVSLFLPMGYAYADGRPSLTSSKVDRLRSPSRLLVPQNVRCQPFDIVLLVDQSASMFSSSDPQGYRFEVAKLFLERLIRSRQGVCKEAVHRFGLITFGDRAEVIVPLSRIDLGEQADPELWSASYKTKIDEAAIDRSQSGTDFFEAFEAAKRLFEVPLVSDPVDCDPRRQVVILLTDGHPEPEEVEDMRNYMCTLVDLLTVWQETSIWVATFNAGRAYLSDPGCNGSIRRDWEIVASRHGGELVALPYNEQALSAFVDKVVIVEKQEISMENILPESGALVPLHDSCPACLIGKVQPVRLEFTLTDQKGISVDPATIASGAPEGLYKVRLVGPDSQRWEDLKLDMKQLGDGFALVTVGGISVTMAGTYHFEIEPQSGAFKNGFLPADEGTVQIDFERKDTLWTDPGTCWVVVGTVGVILPLVSTLVLYSFISVQRKKRTARSITEGAEQRISTQSQQTRSDSIEATLSSTPAPVTLPIKLSDLRRQLNQCFDDPGLDAFCLDHFPEVYDKFSRGMRRDEKISALLDHCRRHPPEQECLISLLSSQSKDSASLASGPSASIHQVDTRDTQTDAIGGDAHIKGGMHSEKPDSE